MDRKHLYQIYTKHEQYTYFVPHVDPRLKRYIHNQIPDDSSAARVLEIARISIEQLRELPPAPKDYTLTQQHQSGSITALLGYTLFAQRQLRQYKFATLLERYFQGTDLEDVCQFSLVIVSSPARFLHNFQPQEDWYPSFCQYCYNKFPKSLTDELRKLAGEGFKRTNLGLLKRTSPSTVSAAIDRVERDNQCRERLLLLHDCLQETVQAQPRSIGTASQTTVAATEFSTTDPQPAHYDALLARYRSRQQPQDLAISDRDELKILLTELGNSVRNYHQPTSSALPLDAPAFEGEDATSEVTIGDRQEARNVSVSLEDGERRELALDLLDRISGVEVERDLPRGIVAVESNCQVATTRLSALKWFLLYGLQLTEKEVGSEVNLPQYTISRQHKSEIAKLARELYFSYEKLPPTKQLAAEILDRYVDYIEPICEDYYAQLALDLLDETIASTTSASIVDEFIDRIETHWQMQFKPDGGGLSKVYAFVQRLQQRGKWDDESKIHKSLRVRQDS